MLAELRARQLGVIDDLSLLLGPGMTALTGETGAGKTLVVEAIELLLGGRSDPVMVRPGADGAAVEGRFLSEDDDGRECEVVLARVLPADGRARAYIEGRMASTSALADAGGPLVDLHGQHAHQSLLAPAAQRDALDMAGGIDMSSVTAARARLRQVEADLAAIGGDPRARVRELDLLRFQIDELDRAGIDEPDEETRLLAEQDRLAAATALRDAAAAAYEALAGDGGAVDRLGDAVSMLPGGSSLDGLRDRLRSLEEEVADAARHAREEAESLEDDPIRLAEVGARLRALSELRRKYGETLTEVLAYRDDACRRAEQLAANDERAARLEQARSNAATDVAAAEERVRRDRRIAAGPFSAAVQAQLHGLAMPHARFEVDVGDGPAGDPVTWMLGANPGEPLLPLRKVASGGELARTMLAVRLVLSGVEPAGTGEHPKTLIFDEVDAGVGGEAAAAVGRALAAVAHRHQVVVVTHLAQVAACADAQVVMRKNVSGGRTTAFAELVAGEARVVELSRMLSGQPDSVTARRHAAELLESQPGRGYPRRRSTGKPSRAR